MNRALLISVALLGALWAGGCDGGEVSATAAAPSIHLPAAPGRPGVGYFELDVRPAQGALVSVRAPGIGRIETHETMTSGNMTRMRPLERIPIAEEGRLRFAPGGRHLMLFEMDPALRPGDRVELTFNFERGPARTMAATVRAAGDARH